MTRGCLTVLVVAALWVAAAGSVLAEDGFRPVETESSSVIVGGNVVAARERAVRQAMSDAVLQQLDRMLTSDGPSQPVDPALRAKISAGAARYVRTHRVLEEHVLDDRIVLRLLTVCDSHLLRRDLLRGSHSLTTVAADRSLSGAATKVQLELTLTDASGPSGNSARVVRIERRLRQRLEAAGIVVAAIRGGDPGVWGQPGGRGRFWRLRLRLETNHAPGVRGLDLPGARCHVSVVLRSDSQGTPPWMAERDVWAAGSTIEVAKRNVVDRAVDEASEAVVDRLAGRAEAAGSEQAETRAGEVALHVESSTSLQRLRELCVTIVEDVDGTGSCDIRSVRSDGVILGLGGGRSAEYVAKAIDGKAAGSFVVRVDQVRGHELWLAFDPLPMVMPDAPDHAP